MGGGIGIKMKEEERAKQRSVSDLRRSFVLECGFTALGGMTSKTGFVSSTSISQPHELLGIYAHNLRYRYVIYFLIHRFLKNRAKVLLF